MGVVREIRGGGHLPTRGGIGLGLRPPATLAAGETGKKRKLEELAVLLRQSLRDVVAAAWQRDALLDSLPAAWWGQP